MKLKMLGSGSVDVAETTFGVEFNEPLVHQVVTALLSGGRAGTKAQVLVEKDRQGLSQHYATVKLDFDAEPGAIVEARVTAAGDGFLLASRAP